jgi:hypothetical protein
MEDMLSNTVFAPAQSSLFFLVHSKYNLSDKNISSEQNKTYVRDNFLMLTRTPKAVERCKAPDFPMLLSLQIAQNRNSFLAQ